MAKEERNVFQKIGDAVVDFAPGIATILTATGVGAPAAAAIGAVGALGKAFGLGSKAKPEEVLAAISTDPEIRLKAMVAENDFIIKQRDQDLEGMRLQIGAVQSAQNKALEETKATGTRDYEDKFFDWVIVIGFIVVFVFLVDSKPAESTYMGMMIGAIITAFGSVVNYRKGSTIGSKEKNAMLFNSAPPKANDQ